MWETWVQSLGWEDPLDKGKATHSSILAIPVQHMQDKYLIFPFTSFWKFPCSSVGKKSACSGDLGSIPGLGRSPGEENGTHSSILARKIPWTKEPDRLQSMGLQELDRTQELNHHHHQVFGLSISLFIFLCILQILYANFYKEIIYVENKMCFETKYFHVKK